MALRVTKHGVILAPTNEYFESKCVFNPGSLQEGNTVHIIYRAQDQNYISSCGYARLDGPLKVVERWTKPFVQKRYPYEKNGMEDPCLVKIGKTIYMTYVAHDGRDAVIAYMYGPSIFKLKRGGIISAKISYEKAAKLFQYSQLKDTYYTFAAFYEKYNSKNILVWEKDGVLFPEKVGGKFALMHRILPDIQLARFSKFEDLKKRDYWAKHIKNLRKHVVMEGSQAWEMRHIGGGAPPLKTKQGWVCIYHGVEQNNSGRIYHAGAALLDLKDPRKVIARLPEPLFSPTEDFETTGLVNNVVFPTGISVFDKRLYIYYGTSDTFTAVASVDIESLIKELLKNRLK